MTLDEETCLDTINGYTQQDWQPLFDLIPEIEATACFEEWADAEKDEDGAYVLPYSIPAPVVSKFLKAAYAIPIIINFAWSRWDEGRQMAKDSDFDFDLTDLTVKCKLITSIVRNDRFCEGALVNAFESGLMLKVMVSMRKQVAAMR